MNYNLPVPLVTLEELFDWLEDKPCDTTLHHTMTFIHERKMPMEQGLDCRTAPRCRLTGIVHRVLDRSDSVAVFPAMDRRTQERFRRAVTEGMLRRDPTFESGPSRNEVR